MVVGIVFYRPFLVSILNKMLPNGEYCARDCLIWNESSTSLFCFSCCLFNDPLKLYQTHRRGLTREQTAPHVLFSLEGTCGFIKLGGKAYYNEPIHFTNLNDLFFISLVIFLECRKEKPKSHSCSKCGKSVHPLNYTN